MDGIGGGGSVAGRAAWALQRAMLASPGGAAQLEGAAPGGFEETLKRMLGEVSELQTESQDAISAFVRGEPVELHQVMAAVEEAGIALELLIEIRNRLTEAYRTVIQMQN
ncbi:MAG: flagellar hook-basal body complex protein FliE [Gemmatimonadales bacterium]|nr:MAG: flagellar hook-basal body complex protein FliE [Gemmatimonadales bacterium]